MQEIIDRARAKQNASFRKWSHYPVPPAFKVLIGPALGFSPKQLDRVIEMTDRVSLKATGLRLRKSEMRAVNNKFIPISPN